MKKIFWILVLMSTLITLVACGGSNNPPIDPPAKLDITNVSLSDKTVTYDGNEHSILVVGTLPTGVTVSYTNNGKSAVGTYQVTATLSGEAYNTKVLSATLTISAKIISGISLSDLTVTYDGNEHSLVVTGEIPTGVSVTYTNNNKTDVGTYEVTATLTGENFQTLTLTANLVINNRVITGLTLEDKEVEYDGNLHKIEVLGNLPSGVTVTYTSSTTGILNEAREIGVYEVTATLSGVGYETLVLTANLTINAYGETLFTGITFDNLTVTHDGNPHTIEIDGVLPEGTSVVYTSTTSGITNTATNAGVYNITVTITKTGYQTLTLQAVLTITEQVSQTFEDVTFDNVSIEYDSFEHDIVVEGILPEGTTVSYASNVDGVTNKASEVGVYEITVTLTKPGYDTLTLNATLTIKAVDKERFIFVDGDDIYFNNGLDDENLYVINQDGISKVNNDEARYIMTHNGFIHYVSNGLVSTSIRSFSGTDAQTIFSANAQYLISDGINLYYAVNPLFGEAGIYMLNIDAEEPVLTKVFSGKAKHLTIIDGFIYFANGNDDYKLYKIDKSAINGSATLVSDIKIKELQYYNGSLYFTVNNLLGDYLARYIIASNTMVKLTSDNAKYITIAGGYVYYSNVDLINTEVFGKGLYRVPLNALVDNNLPGELVYQTEYNVSSLYAQDDTTILFYRLSDKHLLSIDTTTNIVTDLMEEFTSPVENTAQLLSKFESFVWGSRVYYINNYVDGALFYYDTKTNENIRVTSSGVKSFSIVGDYLYFNQISWLINNDIYMINLKQGGLPLKVSSNDGRDMVVYNGFLYFVKENASGVGTAISRVALDGTFTEVEVYAYNAHNLTVIDGKLYFIKGAGVDEIWRADLASNGDLANLTRLGSDKTDWFVIVGGQLYYRAVGTFTKTLSKMNVDGTNKVVLISGYDPISFTIKDGFIYFTNDTLSSPTDGIYKANLDGTNVQLLYANTTNNDGYGIEMHIVGNYLYYYSKSGVVGNLELNRLNLTTLTTEVIQ